MEYGIPWPPDMVSEKDLEACPFHLFHNHDIWVLCKYYSFIYAGKKVNVPLKIHEYASVDEVLFDFLQNNHWFCTLSSGARIRLEEEINQVFLFQSESSKKHTNKQKFQLIQQFTRRELQGGKCVAAPILSDLYRAAGEHNLPHPNTCAEAMDLAQKIKFKIPEDNIRVFDTSDELAVWALSYLIEHDKLIGRCKTCGRYFIKPHGNSKHCGVECYKNRETTGECLGENEIRLRYKSIKQWFGRKSKSRSEYEYYDSGKLPKTYDTKALFSGFDFDLDPSEFIFRAEHFCKINDAYKEQYDIRYDKLKKLKKAVDYQLAKEEDYQKEKDIFVQWLDNVRIQLDYFLRYRDSRSK